MGEDYHAALNYSKDLGSQTPSTTTCSKTDVLSAVSSPCSSWQTYYSDTEIY